jgi:hypothetical protein
MSFLKELASLPDFLIRNSLDLASIYIANQPDQPPYLKARHSANSQA